jgi:hypothetical protein
MAKTITRLFDSFYEAERAVIELENIGVAHGDISLVARDSGDENSVGHVRKPHDDTAASAAAKDAGAGAAVGGVVGAAGGILAGLGLLAIPGLGPVVAAGWLASAAVGAVVGGAVVGAAGGLVGALTNAGVSPEEADFYAEAVRRGGTLVSAKVKDELADTAEAALNRIPSVDVATRRSAFLESGWDRFDAAAAPLSDAEIERERARWPGR